MGTRDLTDASHLRSGEVVGGDEFFEEFFAPTSTDMVHGLVAEYRHDRQRIAGVVELASRPDFRAVWHLFAAGNATEERGRTTLEKSAEQMFREEGAVGQLNALYWSKAFNLTDVYDAMPQARRNQWNEQIRCPEGIAKDYSEVRNERANHPERFDAKGKYLNSADGLRVPRLPDFEEETVRATLMELLNSRAQFLAERVDGIFRSLSGEHVTNSPAAFRNRMIIAHLRTSCGTTNHDRVGVINDLRCVIAKFMGRDEPSWRASEAVVEFARLERRGEWVTLDGGALRLRAYKCGTAHLEVHPDMAWRLNATLAHLYPMAIPPEFRTKPKRKPKAYQMMSRPLPFAVVEVLAAIEPAYRLEKSSDFRRDYDRIKIPNAVQITSGTQAARDEVERVLAYLGGVKVKNDRGGTYFEFDYYPREVIREVVASGCLPDQKAHQYYPTPESLAQAAVEMAQIGSEHTCLEPSAGTGGLADLMPQDRTVCIEISALHCKVLEAKGFDVRLADFLQMPGGKQFDRIVMNPPFSEGRWQAHLQHASAMLAPGGRLVAILPSSAKGKDLLPGWEVEWSRVFDNEFSGASVSVVIVAADCPGKGGQQ